MRSRFGGQTRLCPGKATEKVAMSGRSSEEGGGGIGAGMPAGTGWGVGDALGSIQKSQKATKSGHGQVTFHFPSSPL